MSRGLTREAYLEQEAAVVPAGSDGLMTVLDWLATTDAPFRKGMMLGFDARHTRGHVYRSILEAIALTMKFHVDAMCDELGVSLGEIVISGGGAEQSARHADLRRRVRHQLVAQRRRWRWRGVGRCDLRCCGDRRISQHRGRSRGDRHVNARRSRPTPRMVTSTGAWPTPSITTSAATPTHCSSARIPSSTPRTSRRIVDMALTSDEIVDRLRDLLGDEQVVTDPDELRRSSIDNFRKLQQIFDVYTMPLPAAVVMVRNTDDVAQVLRFADEHRVNVIPRTGGTATEGGLESPVADSIVVDGSRMDRIISIDPYNMQATAQCGVPLQVLEGSRP